MDLNIKMTVSELLTHHPLAVSVFVRRKLLCVGCPTESFHTLEDVACIYGIALAQLLRELQGTIDAYSKIGR